MSSTIEDSDAAVGQRIQSIRTQQGMSQAEFADALGISVRAYQNYERGERPVSKQLLCALKTTFGTSSDYILNGDKEVEAGSPLGQLPTWADAAQMADLLHFIFQELDHDLFLQEQMPEQEPFGFMANVYQQVVTHLPKGASANSDEAYKLARHFAKEEIEHYNRILAIARRNAEARNKRGPKEDGNQGGKTSQTFHGSVGQVGGGDINNDFGDKDR